MITTKVNPNKVFIHFSKWQNSNAILSDLESNILSYIHQHNPVNINSIVKEMIPELGKYKDIPRKELEKYNFDELCQHLARTTLMSGSITTAIKRLIALKCITVESRKGRQANEPRRIIKRLQESMGVAQKPNRKEL